MVLLMPDSLSVSIENQGVVNVSLVAETGATGPAGPQGPSGITDTDSLDMVRFSIEGLDFTQDTSTSLGVLDKDFVLTKIITQSPSSQGSFSGSFSVKADSVGVFSDSIQTLTGSGSSIIYDGSGARKMFTGQSLDFDVNFSSGSGSSTISVYVFGFYP